MAVVLLVRARSGLLLAGLAFALTLVARSALALEVPALRGRVNDYADVISAPVEQRLEQKLAAYEKATGRQYAVLTVDSLAGDSIESFSIRTVEAWKLGRKGQDDGLLLLVVPGDRKVRIEVGYGLEGEITDARSSRLIREVLTPAFRKGDYDGGVERALDVLTGRIEAAPEETEAERRRPSLPLGWLLPVLFVLLPFLSWLGRLGRRGRRRGGFLGAGFPVGGYWGSSHRGGFGGGGFGGGGFGGGGFGGGGGGFGGGGASGSW